MAFLNKYLHQVETVPPCRDENWFPHEIVGWNLSQLGWLGEICPNWAGWNFILAKWDHVITT